MKNAISILLLFLTCATGFAQNHWIPNSAPFEDYMSVIAVVSVNGEEQTSTSLEVGAFCGEECRGSALAAFFPPTQRYIYQLPVYGNNGDAITFKLFDHDTQTELVLDSETNLTYTDNGYGSLGNPCQLVFTSETPSGFPIPLNVGWNWISYLLLTEMPVAEAFASITPNDGDILKSQDAFCTYNASIHQWIGSLQTMRPGIGYMYLNNGAPMVLYYPEVGD